MKPAAELHPFQEVETLRPAKKNSDWPPALLASLLSFLLYAWTAAPSVTLLDSGEFLVAAMHLGVPHPTGYPLWTMLAWLFQLLPLGTPAWEIALFSGIAGAAASGLFAWLSSNMLRWFFPEIGSLPRTVLSVAWALLFAWSEPMWSQAVIAEVYTLHALLVGLYLLCLYFFIRSPEKEGWLPAAFFCAALAFSNHHLTLALIPLPFLAVLLLRRDLFWDLLLAASLSSVLFYLLFAILSEENPTLRTAIRWAWINFGVLVVFVFYRRFRVHWKLIGILPFAIALGLLPYAYMPLASETNPPMNWGYTRDKDGFFYSLNRTQYGGSLDEQLLRSVGKLVGTDGLLPKENKEEPWNPLALSRLEKMQNWSVFFQLQLFANFTPLAFVFLLCPFLLIRRLELRQRVWLYLLFVCFFLAAFLQPFLDLADTDKAGWWLQMPYHTYTMLAFCLLCVPGAAYIGLWLKEKSAAFFAGYLLLFAVLPLWPAWKNYASCSQRGRWAGWEFGHDMLAKLPRDAVVFGGTDPGRFVPTFFIFGESPLPPHLKRDPEFDRRDLYILTQNALGDPFYLRYIRDHYGENRPAPKNGFERWLGRENAYPKKPLVLPDNETVRSIAKECAETSGLKADLHSGVAEWIFEQNKESHAFFVEESFPLKWSYDRALPSGFLYQILPEPLEKLPPETVRNDLVFWQKFLEKALADPSFAGDFDARRSFSKLRHTGGKLYEHRKMLPEAELAYRQALAIYPSAIESLLPLGRLLWEQNKFDAAFAIWDEALADDPRSDSILALRAVASQKKTWETEASQLQEKICETPGDDTLHQKLVEGHLAVMDYEKADAALAAAIASLPENRQFLLFALQIQGSRKQDKEALATARNLLALQNDALALRLLIAGLELKLDNRQAFYEEAREIIRTGGIAGKESLHTNAAFSAVAEEEDFLKILSSELPASGSR